jgi:hypothetical protein
VQPATVVNEIQGMLLEIGSMTLSCFEENRSTSRRWAFANSLRRSTRLGLSLSIRRAKLGSERLTGVLQDRITHHVHILELNGESYLLKQCKHKRSPQPGR